MEDHRRRGTVGALMMTRRFSVDLGLTIIAAICSAIPATGEVSQNGNRIDPQKGWEFKYQRPESKCQFVIGAWLGPDDKDAEVRVYKEAGFNVVMIGRYMAEGSYGSPEDITRQLDLAQQHGLSVMLDTYTQKDKPWGGRAFDDFKSHHPASLEELKWIHQTYGAQSSCGEIYNRWIQRRLQSQLL